MQKISSFKSFISESNQKKSEFDYSIKISYLYKDNIEYEFWKPQFDKYGYGISILEKKLILIDGEVVKKLKLDKDELDFIEAHEYSHFKLGKKASEVDCDWLAIANLWNKGKKAAAKVGIDNFVDRHGMEFDTSDLKGYDQWIGESRKRAADVLKECKHKDIEIISVLKDPEKYYTHLTTLDRISARQIITHAWDIYVESII